MTTFSFKVKATLFESYKNLITTFLHYSTDILTAHTSPRAFEEFHFFGEQPNVLPKSNKSHS